MFGRYPVGNVRDTIADLIPPRWEECGRRCHEDENCAVWAYGHGDGDDRYSKYKCHFFYAEDGISDTEEEEVETNRNGDWISGPEGCYRSDQCDGKSEENVIKPNLFVA